MKLLATGGTPGAPWATGLKADTDCQSAYFAAAHMWGMSSLAAVCATLAVLQVTPLSAEGPSEQHRPEKPLLGPSRWSKPGSSRWPATEDGTVGEGAMFGL